MDSVDDSGLGDQLKIVKNNCRGSACGDAENIHKTENMVAVEEKNDNCGKHFESKNSEEKKTSDIKSQPKAENMNEEEEHKKSKVEPKDCEDTKSDNLKEATENDEVLYETADDNEVHLKKSWKEGYLKIPSWKFVVPSCIIVAVMAVLAQIEFPTQLILLEKTVALPATIDEVFNMVSDLEKLPEWMPEAGMVIAQDSLPIGKEKTYSIITSAPIGPGFRSYAKIGKFKALEHIEYILESLIFPRRITFDFNTEKDSTLKRNLTRLTVKMDVGKMSYLYRYTIHPCLSFVAGNSVRNGLFRLLWTFQ